MISRQHRILIMFYNNQRIAQIPELLQRGNELIVIPLVQPDTRLVQNICHSHQPGSNLCCQPDPLCLSPGEGCRSAGKTEIIQSDVHKKTQPGTDLFQYQPPNLLLPPGQFQSIHKFLEIQYGKLADICDVLVPHRHRQRFLFQSFASTRMAWRDLHKALVLLLCHLRTSLPVSFLNIIQYPLKGDIVNTAAMPPRIVYLNTAPLCAMPDNVMNLSRIILKRRVQRESIFRRHGLHCAAAVAPLFHHRLPSRSSNGSLIDTQRRIRYDQLLIKLHPVSNAKTVRAGTKWVIKGKASGFQFFNTDAAVWAGKALTEIDGISPDHIHNHQSVRKLQHIFNGIRQPFLNPVFDHQPVYNNLDIVFLVLLQFDLLTEFILVPIDHYPDVATFLCLVQNLYMLSLTSADYRCQKLDLRAFRQLHHLIHHHIHTLFLNLFPTFRTMRDPDPGVEQPVIIINLCHCPHRRTRIPVGGFLVYGNRRRQTLDAFHIRFLHLSKELPGVGRKRLHISSLPFRIDGIKSKG